MHGEPSLVLAYLPAPTLFFTPSLARLRASRLEERGWERGLLAGISPQVSGEMRVDRGRHLPAASGKLREGIPPTISRLLTEQLTAGSHRQTAWNLHGWVGDAIAPHRCTHMCTHMRANM